jgi:hypothetical protein
MILCLAVSERGNSVGMFLTKYYVVETARKVSMEDAEKIAMSLFKKIHRDHDSKLIF